MGAAKMVRAVAIVSGLGALVGFALGALVVVALGALRSGAHTNWSEFALGATLSGGVGAAFGVVLAPLMGFLLLRHVSLGRAILWTGTGTLVGILAAFILGGSLLPMLVGFVTGGVALRLRAPAGARVSVERSERHIQ
jgi:hypothetical protein